MLRIQSQGCTASNTLRIAAAPVLELNDNRLNHIRVQYNIPKVVMRTTLLSLRDIQLILNTTHAAELDICPFAVLFDRSKCVSFTEKLTDTRD